MVTMRSQVQHLPPLHHMRCPLQASLHLPVQEPLIYCCRGFRSSAQIGTFIHTWPMDQHQTFGSHVCVCIYNINVPMFKSTVQDVRSSSYWMSICMVMCVRTWRMWKEVHQDCNTFSASSAVACDSLHRCCFSNITCPFTHYCNNLNKNLCIMTVTFAVKKVIHDLCKIVRLTRHCPVWKP